MEWDGSPVRGFDKREISFSFKAFAAAAAATTAQTKMIDED